MLNPAKCDMNVLHICPPPHLSDVATLPWEIGKVTFKQYCSLTSQIIYVVSEKKTDCNCCSAAELFTGDMYHHYYLFITPEGST